MNPTRISGASPLSYLGAIRLERYMTASNITRGEQIDMLGLFVARVADFYWALGSLMADRTPPQGLLDQISLERLFADIHGLKSRGQFDELDAQSPKDLLGEAFDQFLSPVM